MYRSFSSLYSHIYRRHKQDDIIQKRKRKENNVQDVNHCVEDTSVNEFLGRTLIIELAQPRMRGTCIHNEVANLEHTTEFTEFISTYKHTDR